MIDLIKAENEFKRYVQNYDMTLDGIERKYHHSFRVMDLSRRIAESLDLNEEQINLATLIGLLHDIARFEEFTRYSGFSLRNEFDHGDFALEILKKDNFIRKFIDIDKYDDIIFTAIRCHNKFKIEDGLDDETVLFCKIIRDADKIDIFYEATEFFWNKEEDLKVIETCTILDQYYEQFMKKEPIYRIEEQSALDEVIACIAFIFDLNFKYSFKLIKEGNYINKTLDRFNFKNEDTYLKIKGIKEMSEIFLNENV